MHWLTWAYLGPIDKEIGNAISSFKTKIYGLSTLREVNMEMQVGVGQVDFPRVLNTYSYIITF